MTSTGTFEIIHATEEHVHFAEAICFLIEESARIRGTGIAKRDPEYVRSKIREGKSVLAFAPDGELVGFCYIETWQHGRYVANSGLIVHPDYRGQGVGRFIKKAIFDLSLKKFPDAKIFGITTSSAVLKINFELGYRPVTFAELTTDDAFWKGCETCVNFDILMRNSRRLCLCTGMLYDTEEKAKHEQKQKELINAQQQSSPGV